MLNPKLPEHMCFDIGHSSHLKNPGCLRTSALGGSAWIWRVLPLIAAGPKGSLKVECAVRPPGRVNAAVPVDAVQKIPHMP